MLINSTVNSFSEVRLTLRNAAFSEVRVLGRDGVLTGCDHTKQGDELLLRRRFDYLSTMEIMLTKGGE